MAITDAKKVDYLWKKIGYGATKTDTNAAKKAPNEAIASPLLLRGDRTWNQANEIAGTLPGSSTGVVTVYPTSNPQETTADGTAAANRTWKTGLTDWIPPELGSTYQVKVYIHTSSDAGNAASSGDQVFATGSGNNDEWFFDYQSGVLHFIGNNLPSAVALPFVLSATSFKNPAKSFASNACKLKSNVSWFAALLASGVIFTKLVSKALIPVTAISVLIPAFVIPAMAPVSSLNFKPALAATGATLPIKFDSSQKVVCPSLTAANSASLASFAVKPLAA